MQDKYDEGVLEVNIQRSGKEAALGSRGLSHGQLPRHHYTKCGLLPSAMLCPVGEARDKVHRSSIQHEQFVPTCASSSECHVRKSLSQEGQQYSRQASKTCDGLDSRFAWPPRHTDDDPCPSALPSLTQCIDRGCHILITPGVSQFEAAIYQEDGRETIARDRPTVEQGIAIYH